MISIVVCSNTKKKWMAHADQIKGSVGCEHEYIRIDNTENSMGICAAYNKGTDKSHGDIIVFMHEDVFVVTPAWGKILTDKFDSDDSIGLVGVAGTQLLLADNPLWIATGRPWMKGKVVHETDESSGTNITVFSREQQDADVVAVDGLFIAIRKSALKNIRFDEETFDLFHFYDLDISMQLSPSYRLIVTQDLLVKHKSGGSFGDTWKAYGEKFLKKYSDRLPVNCSDVPFPQGKYVPFEHFKIEDTVDPKTAERIKKLGNN